MCDSLDDELGNTLSSLEVEGARSMVEEENVYFSAIVCIDDASTDRNAILHCKS